MLSNKSDQELSWILDDYGIKHGPVVGSTRSLYEKKLRDAMAKEKNMRGASGRGVYREQNASWGRNHHRLHEDEDVYLHQHRSWGHDAFSRTRGNAMFSTEDREMDIVQEPAVSPYYTGSQRRYRAVRQEQTRTQDTAQDRVQDRVQKFAGSDGFVPMWLKVVVYLVVVGVLVFIFISWEEDQQQPFTHLT